METVGHLKVYYHIDPDILDGYMPVGGFSVLLITFPIYVAEDPGNKNTSLFLLA